LILFLKQGFRKDKKKLKNSNWNPFQFSSFSFFQLIQETNV
jgi:hypothetical protein